jgi:NAD(P)-dependent dehydrogenase (short-subunit alcohol dehydrogenase family)
MDLRVAGKSYIVVGGSRGMGWETVRILAAEGAHVAVVCRDPDAIADQAAELARDHGTTVRAYSGDVSVPGNIDRTIADIAARQGAPRGLAMTHHAMNTNAPFDQITEADWTMLFQNSLMGAVRTCNAVLPLMAANGGGNVVLVSAYSARAPKPQIVAYAVFKAALVNLTKSLAKTYGPHGIRVNSVAPGAIKTGRYDSRIAALLTENPEMTKGEAEQIVLSRIDMKVALGRYGEPSEAADMIAFLLSERAAYATGLIANVDGGTDF